LWLRSSVLNKIIFIDRDTGTAERFQKKTYYNCSRARIKIIYIYIIVYIYIQYLYIVLALTASL